MAVRSIGRRDREEAVEWCDRELANLVSATSAAVDTGAHEIAWKFPVALFGYFNLRKPWTEWIGTHELGIAAAYRDRGDAATAVDYGLRALEMWRDLDEPRGEGMSLNIVGEAYLARADYAEAETWFGEALTVRRTIDDRWGQGMTLAALGMVHRGLGNQDAARDALREAVAILNDLGDPTLDEVRNRLAEIE